jgi:NET1-associated nuclear protein 1 (U3 small nucleolar RNA-associated protein 17)
LPHLPSPIRSITISSDGALYAVQLADKSITVISATELHSVATIDGLQLPSLVGTSDKAAARNLEGKYPAVIHPLQPERLLVAIPDGDSQSLSYVQTFNIQTGSHISRQALTRTNVTALNKGPEGTPILPPSVELMELSANGQWLATIDSWTPPQRDVEASSSALLSNNVQRSEIYLKFWRWNDTREIWELAARVESPHISSSGEPVKILSLKARPDRSEFVTFGVDDTLRVWQPVVRHGGSVRAQNRSDSVEHTWKSQHAVKLTGNTAHDAGQKVPSRVMSFSEDGSIVAVCVKNVIHLIDTRQWTVNCSRNAFTSEKVRAIGWLGRFLVILSEQSLAIWNVVEDVLKTPVEPDMASKGSSHKYITLAVDSSTDTFAVVTRMGGLVNQPGHNSLYGIAIYSPSAMTTSFETVLEKPPLNLLADSSTGGYVVIDHAANIWRLGGGNGKSQGLALPADGGEQQATAGFGDIFGRLGQKALESRSISTQQASSALALRNLGGIFDRAPPFALPPATTLFKDVINSLVPSS